MYLGYRARGRRCLVLGKSLQARNGFVRRLSVNRWRRRRYRHRGRSRERRNWRYRCRDRSRERRNWRYRCRDRSRKRRNWRHRRQGRRRRIRDIDGRRLRIGRTRRLNRRGNLWRIDIFKRIRGRSDDEFNPFRCGNFDTLPTAQWTEGFFPGYYIFTVITLFQYKNPLPININFDYLRRTYHIYYNMIWSR